MRRMTLREQLDAHTIPEPNTGCLLWEGSSNADGYGRIGKSRKGLYAHRVSWELESGDNVPGGMFVLHRCDTPACVNPAHLFLGTKLDNARDCVVKGRRKCLSGEAHGMARLTEAIVVECIARLAAGENTSKLAREFKVSQSAMWKALHGETWQHLHGTQPQQGNLKC